VSIDLREMFSLDVNLLQLFLRTSIVYFVLLLMMRVVTRREMGSFELPDLLMVVLIADGVQNGMAGDYKSVTGALVVAATLIGWNYALDLLSYRSSLVRSLLRPSLLPLVRDGRMLRRNMRRELVTPDELTQHLRVQGVEDVRDVRLAILEPDGEISVFKYGDGEQRPQQKKRTAGAA
jgi:uncharacterized membrane protein YcaP (DUF421 family)